jgi:hypothetical protein
VLRVFTDDQERHGSSLGMEVDGAVVPNPQHRGTVCATTRGPGCRPPGLLSLR